MKKLPIYLVLIISIIIFNCENKNKNIKNSIQVILDHYKDSVKTYGIVTLVDDGIKLDTGSIGFSYNDQTINTKNRFCIGSCTKMFTATIILKLYEQGLLNIDDNISNYLPSYKNIDSTITIKQLLNHTSGLKDFTKNGFINTPLHQPDFDYSDSFILSLIDTLEFKKGTQYGYCNTNYFLLRKIIENITDKPYEFVLQDYIITPLELKNTFPYFSNKIDLLAHPIINQQDLHSIPKYGTNKISIGIGNIVSDVYDLNKFIRALLIDKKILKTSTIDLMTNFYSYKKNKVGLGLFLESYGNSILLGHTGRQISYTSFVFTDIKTNKSIIILVNNANDTFADKIIEDICNLK